MKARRVSSTDPPKTITFAFNFDHAHHVKTNETPVLFPSNDVSSNALFSEKCSSS